MAVHLVGPVPTPNGALGGRQESEGCGPASGASASAQPSAGRKKAWWLPPDTTQHILDTYVKHTHVWVLIQDFYTLINIWKATHALLILVVTSVSLHLCLISIIP